MTVVHTPILGPGELYTLEQNEEVDIKPRVGFNVDRMHGVRTVQLDSEPDMKNCLKSHGSPNLSNITFDKSPMMVNGTMEKFGNICQVISK